MVVAFTPVGDRTIWIGAFRQGFYMVKIHRLATLIASFLWLFCPVLSFAALSNIVLTPTYESVGVSVDFSGPDARAYIEFKGPSDAAWRRGVDMVRPLAGPFLIH